MATAVPMWPWLVIATAVVATSVPASWACARMPRARSPRPLSVSSLKKARKSGSQFRNDFPDLPAKWPQRETSGGVAWRVPPKQIIDNGYNLTLASLGLVEPEKTDHAEPEDRDAFVHRQSGCGGHQQRRTAPRRGDKFWLDTNVFYWQT